jgi:hypothetical protein
MYCGGDVNAVDICNIHCKKKSSDAFKYHDLFCTYHFFIQSTK